jgi:hypothetical protein
MHGHPDIEVGASPMVMSSFSLWIEGLWLQSTLPHSSYLRSAAGNSATCLFQRRDPIFFIYFSQAHRPRRSKASLSPFELMVLPRKYGSTLYSRDKQPLM